MGETLHQQADAAPPSERTQATSTPPMPYPRPPLRHHWHMVTPVDAFTARPLRQPVLRADQERGLEAVVRHLRRPHSRALYVSATGTGKTLVSIRAADALKARLVLVVVPTLDLAAQTALAWRRDGHQEHMVIVSSMDASAHDVLAARRIGSTSNSQSLAALMSVVGRTPISCRP
ncbi:DEAD/DEAH box helicase family protein [Streptomyces sp. INA 01156]